MASISRIALSTATRVSRLLHTHSLRRALSPSLFSPPHKMIAVRSLSSRDFMQTFVYSETLSDQERRERELGLFDIVRCGTRENLDYWLVRGVENGDLDVNCRNMEGETLLTYAVEFGKEDMIKSLLKHKVSVNAPDRVGDTPLHVAARENHLEAVHLLLAAGAQADLKNNEGMNTLRDATRIIACFLNQNSHNNISDPLLHRAASPLTGLILP